jgi:metal-dependent hydrolase (beta-lactamase superfamily II)
LLENLRASGYQSELVDEILLKHLHADRVGGIALAGKWLFLNRINDNLHAELAEGSHPRHLRKIGCVVDGNHEK